MARAIRARGEGKPNAMRVRKWILVLVDSAIAFGKVVADAALDALAVGVDIVDAEAGEIGEAGLPPLRSEPYRPVYHPRREHAL